MVARINNIDIAIGDRVRIARQCAGISLSQLSNVLGITHQQLSKYEKGIDRITAGRVFTISKILETPIDFFFEIKQEKVSK